MLVYKQCVATKAVPRDGLSRSAQGEAQAGAVLSAGGFAHRRCKEVIDGERRRRNMRPRQESRQSVLEVQVFPEDFIRRALIELLETSNFDINRIVLDQFRKENCRNILCQHPLDLTV